jgi:hypothetical protein
MLQGFRDILHSYPDNWNINAFAFYACMAKDWPTHLEVSRRMTRTEPRMWAFGLIPEVCTKRAAKTGA